MDAKPNQKGQALVEFIIFLPFMVMMYTVVVSLGDAIHGSINQQKATRAYFYFRMQNNSQISKPQRDGGSLLNNSWNSFGHFFIGWANELQNGANPLAPCYRLNLPFAAAAGDSCDQTYTDVTTQFIRVETVYGACGATFRRSGAPNDFVELPSGSSIESAIDEGSCYIQ
ncbi:MAG: pilus assembly protein [Bacteriovoracaceae bacterium]|nr:pilus assembly protein [Bacteriovoracaceae bacterium]